MGALLVLENSLFIVVDVSLSQSHAVHQACRVSTFENLAVKIIRQDGV